MVWDGERGGARKGVVFPAPPCQRPAFFVPAGLRAGATLLWVISMAKKWSKPGDDLGV